MNPARISPALRREVRERANGCCEYCFLPEERAFFPHEPDHIIATKHGGKSTIDNLALACLDATVSKALTSHQLILSAVNCFPCSIRAPRNGANTSRSKAGISRLELPQLV